MRKVSVIVPVYREGFYFINSINNLLSSKVLEELIMIIDNPSPEFYSKVKSIKCSKLKIIVNEERTGKVSALNKGIELAKGDIVLFLDADVSVPDKQFLEKIVYMMSECDVLDIKSEIEPKGFLGKMMYYEYLSFNIASWLFCKMLKKIPAVNGAAFAVKRHSLTEVGSFRRVVSEDLDWGLRAFKKNLKVMYTKEAYVKVEPLSSWRKWLEQRKRWAFGFAEWLFNNLKDIIVTLIKYPFIVIPAAIMAVPSISILVLDFIVSDEIVLKIASFILIPLIAKTGFSLLPLIMTINIALALKETLVLFSSFAMTAVITGVLAKHLGYRFRIHEYAVYYFIYSLAWLLILVSAVFCYFLTRKIPRLDWKV